MSLSSYNEMTFIQSLMGSIMGAGVVYVLYPKFDSKLRRFGYAIVSCMLSILTASAVLNFLSSRFGLDLNTDNLGVLVVTLCYHIALPPLVSFIIKYSSLNEHLSAKDKRQLSDCSSNHTEHNYTTCSHTNNAHTGSSCKTEDT